MLDRQQQIAVAQGENEATRSVEDEQSRKGHETVAVGEEKRGETAMTCAEFQKVLPYIIETGGNEEEEAHLRSCAVCSDLVQDLRYIAEQAKLLLPMKDPGPQVWDKIQDSLQREGMVKPARARGRLLGSIGKSGLSVVTVTALLVVLRVAVRR